MLSLPSLLVAAMAWSWIAPDRLYYCWDDAPIVAFVPPFVHPEHPPSSTDFDHYIAAMSTVYGVWFGFVGLALMAPGLPLWLMWRSYRTHEKRGFLYIPAAPTWLE
jgi:hypothetical protein